MAILPHSSNDNQGTASFLHSGVISAPAIRSLQRTMHETFGISQLRPGQREVIENVLQGRDTLAIMPTGSGKSLCYQLPALKRPGVTVVVSPLISLMKDQAGKLEEAGVDATQINSSLSSQEHKEAMADIEADSSDFIFTTAERLSDPDFMAILRQHQVDLFVIDEAHCISKWGHDFRPAYLGLAAAIEVLGNPPVLALTATATPDVTQDIASQLGRPGMLVINTGIYRENLHYGVVHATSEAEKTEQVLRLLRQYQGCGIIYAATVKAVEQLHHALLQHGEQAVLYHGQLGSRQRQHNQDMFMRGDCRIMVATNAFGMGIDKPDIRFVVHFHMPANLEAYYQESGRAGRDGAEAFCTLLYWLEDKRIQQFFLARGYPAASEIRMVYLALQSMDAGHSPLSFAQIQHGVPQLTASKVKIALRLLADANMVAQDESLNYRLSITNVKNREFAQLAEVYQKKAEHDREALEHMVFYAQTGFCRWKVLLEYFGEAVEQGHCGHCDNCLHPPEQDLSAVAALQPHTVQPATAENPATLAPGNTVCVPKFGEGRVVSTAGEKVTIAFPNRVTKTFLRSFVKPAPETAVR